MRIGKNKIRQIGLSATVLALSGILLLAGGCAARKKTKAAASSRVVLSEKKKMEKIKTSDFCPTTYQASFKISGAGFLTGEMRIERGQKIWLNLSALGMTMARGEITPDSIKYYERKGKTMFEGTWKQAEEHLPLRLPFDYGQLESFLLGRSVIPIQSEAFSPVFSQGEAVVSSFRADGSGVEVVFSEEHYRPARQSIRTEGAIGTLTASYLYQQVKNDRVPRRIGLRGEGIVRLDISIEFSSVRIDQPLDFPFKMPPGYKTFGGAF